MLFQVDLEGIEQQVKDRKQIEEEERLRSEAFGKKCFHFCSVLSVRIYFIP